MHRELSGHQGYREDPEQSQREKQETCNGIMGHVFKDVGKVVAQCGLLGQQGRKQGARGNDRWKGGRAITPLIPLRLLSMFSGPSTTLGAQCLPQLTKQ